jgi:hypothetical protein
MTSQSHSLSAHDGAPRVINFMLVDTDTGKAVPGFAPLAEGAQLVLAELPPRLSIRANTQPPSGLQVSFALNGTELRVEREKPYMLAGDSDGVLHPFRFTPGEHELTATAMRNKLAGPPARLRFRVVARADADLAAQLEGLRRTVGGIQATLGQLQSSLSALSGALEGNLVERVGALEESTASLRAETSQNSAAIAAIRTTLEGAGGAGGASAAAQHEPTLAELHARIRELEAQVAKQQAVIEGLGGQA